MSFLGRKMQGEKLTLPLLVTDGQGRPAAPDVAPAASIYKDGARVFTVLMPPADRHRTTGLFRYPLFLGTAFPPGPYQVGYFYRITGSGFSASDNFEVVPGGDPEGTIHSMVYVERPWSRFLVQRTDSGALYFRRGPYL
jgi:hypothetical protein